MATKLLAGLVLCMGGCGGRPNAPDLVLSNARVVTLDSARSELTTIAIRGGKILALADSVDPAWLASRPEVIDLGGAVVAPAFTDHHAHLFNIGMALLNQRDHGRLAIDLSAVRSLAEVDSLLRARVAILPKGGWVFGTGWSQAGWGTQAMPTAEMLTRAAPDHPVFFARTDGHAGWLNAAALSRGALTRETADPVGGRIVRLPSGEPSGVLRERANELLTTWLPAPADSDVVTAFRLAALALAARGVVEVYDAGPLMYPGAVALNLDFGRYLALLVRADSVASLPLRINLMIPAPSRLADSLLAAAGVLAELSPRIRITHLKLFADGALGSRGAALSHRYADDTTTSGVARMTSDQIADLGRRALDRGLGVATHAIGDEAVRRTLDAYEMILRERPTLNPGRLRIEHFSYAREEDFVRAARLRVILSIQSNFNSLPEDNPSFGGARLGTSNEPRVYNWARLLAMGATLAEGSDYFTTPGAPLAGVIATLSRKYAVGQGLPDSVGRPLAYRMNAARFDPAGVRVGGVIAVGAPADLVVWLADPFSVPQAELERVGVKLVINAGRVVGANQGHP
jgi:predicted amidohydrolase YtcJ